MTTAAPPEPDMTTDADRADLREIRANVNKMDEDIVDVKLTLSEVQHSLANLTSSQGTQAAAQVELAKAVTELGNQIKAQAAVPAPSALGVIASACADPKVLGQIVLILSTVGALATGAGYAGARATALPPAIVHVGHAPRSAFPEQEPEVKEDLAGVESEDVSQP